MAGSCSACSLPARWRGAIRRRAISARSGPFPPPSRKAASIAGGGFAYTKPPSAPLPLFDGGRLRCDVDAARAQWRAAEKAVQTAFREVADALAPRGTIDEQLAARSARTDAATVALRIADARYRAGVASFLTTLDAQRTAHGARQQLVVTRLVRESNMVELYRSLAGGLDPVDPGEGH